MCRLAPTRARQTMVNIIVRSSFDNLSVITPQWCLSACPSRRVRFPPPPSTVSHTAPLSPTSAAGSESSDDASHLSTSFPILTATHAAHDPPPRYRGMLAAVTRLYVTVSHPRRAAYFRPRCDPTNSRSSSPVHRRCRPSHPTGEGKLEIAAIARSTRAEVKRDMTCASHDGHRRSGIVNGNVSGVGTAKLGASVYRRNFDAVDCGIDVSWARWTVSDWARRLNEWMNWSTRVSN